ncbi:hypothetical protein CRX67_01205 [Enterobacteriaceae bacterium A-F18]|uniref:Uncharacterized protein n=1 Tax=Phytobacter diazotrophicus TaxID=395631 RepID=A0ABN6LVZ8_9ENTR|nr:hypothetical protein C2U51_19585 [Enterobacteriaceae bacterium ENNIH1]MDU7222318.1 hypothetical protein [Citrobacter freundii]QIH61883.1 hypothetical protein CRX67_01205 [Enterobacteriaceae bacterium A-F18]BBE80131.1 hypothetical protein MRY16398_51870 [Phytobacter sp. MRY16-398]BDD53503.1 hypothetical protein PDTA9734_49900 [Phytobacter diazotrophicus]GJL42677.1 hypothetical protein TUM17577_38860 [Enterobacter asburiae]
MLLLWVGLVGLMYWLIAKAAHENPYPSVRLPCGYITFIIYMVCLLFIITTPVRWQASDRNTSWKKHF